MPDTAALRVDGDPPREGTHVVYWCIAQRRMAHNHALSHAAAHARAAGVPLVVLEPLRVDYPHASVRIHQAIVEGMADNAAAASNTPVTYHAYVEPAPGEGKGLLAAWATDAALVVTDHFPHFFLPRMVAAARARIACPFHVVDGNGLVPLASAGPFATAVSFRRHIQRTLGDTWDPPPDAALSHLRCATTSLADVDSWPHADALLADPAKVEELPIDPLPACDHGGSRAGTARLEAFIERRATYLERNQPDVPASGLSPYLHFGHVGAWQAVLAVLDAEDWNPGRLGTKATGARHGWWGVSEAAEAWLDQIVTWRELGFLEMHHRPGAMGFTDLPAWAQETLNQHRGDPREGRATFAQLDGARTKDEIWNAAQRQLREEGTIQNYLRMLWGKNILRWAPDPETALAWMFALNDRYALDGRDPNSVAGIMWCLGRYDRGWPERDVFGKVRTMTSASTRRKLNLDAYLERYG